MSATLSQKLKNSGAQAIIVGGGLAGSECAWQMAKRGIKVALIEQRPVSSTEAHKTDQLAELVCSNSLKSTDPASAPGILKSELEKLDSLILKCAYKHALPAGTSLAVEREAFSAEITKTLEKNPNVEIIREEVEHYEELMSTGAQGLRPIVIATGPLTGKKLAESLQTVVGEQLYFYDAIAPIIAGESINKDIAFLQNRRDKGTAEGSEGDYLNCPFSEEEYFRFIDALEGAEKVPAHDFEKAIYFQGCQPIEAMLERGRKTLAFGPMRPVGLTDPRTGEQPFACMQLRAEDKEGRAWSMVGFQTKLKYPEQQKVFRLIPGLENAEFYRLGSLHRNTFIKSPMVLDKNFRLKKLPMFHFAGQITGVEGYLESTSIGCLVGCLLSYKIKKGADFPPPPPTTAMGALAEYVHNGKIKNFQPMNINFGLIPLDGIGERDKEKKQKMKERAERNFNNWYPMLR